MEGRESWGMFDACAGATKFFTIYIPHIYCYESFCTTSLGGRGGIDWFNCIYSTTNLGLAKRVFNGELVFFSIIIVIAK